MSFVSSILLKICVWIVIAVHRPSTTITEDDRKAALLGQNESLLECVMDAENPKEILECRTDFEELIGVPTDACVEKSGEVVCNPADIKVTDPAYKA